jgi:hypothetical protein
MSPLSSSPTLEELERLVEGNDEPTRITGPQFGLPENLALVQRRIASRKDKASRREIKRLIRPENAEWIRQYLPQPGDETHAVVRGDFVFADMIPVILGTATAEHIAAATLGLSKANAEMLKALCDNGQCKRLTVVVSHYFSAVDKTTVFPEVKATLGNSLKISRTHCKVVLIDAPPNAYVIAGSANLRSSDTAEQFTIWNDKELLSFHAKWIDEIGDC